MHNSWLNCALVSYTGIFQNTMTTIILRH